ncbi:MAG: AmmeMemoRadiSam system protein B [Candidatus Bathyarchaeota archaeon]|nr:AmmeMemoRadiSam system protein B [Candidatus Bathyarchaeota archaeon]
MKIRKPAQAGMFYAGSAASLKKELENCFKHKLGPGKLPNGESISQNRIVTLVCPHAGYMYSGPVAATSYYELARYKTPDNIVIIGPNHTGMGSAISLMNRGTWSTPLGEIQINTDLADSIIENSTIVDTEEEAHIYEHSIEVQLPFLQYLYGNNFSFVPICMMMQDLETSRELGEAIHKASNGISTIIIASTDMTHYEPHSVATEKDMNAIRAIENLDENKLDEFVHSNSISMCGIGPVISSIVYSKKVGAINAKLLSYKTSGDISGDLSSVVGYAAISVTV